MQIFIPADEEGGVTLELCDNDNFVTITSEDYTTGETKFIENIISLDELLSAAIALDHNRMKRLDREQYLPVQSLDKTRD